MRNAYLRVYCAAFFMDFALASGYTATPFYCIDHLEGGARMSGMLFALQFGAYAATSFAAARFVARTKNGLIWAVCGSGLFTVLFPLAIAYRSAYFFGATTLVAMGSFSLIWAALQSWLGAEPDPRTRARRIACFTLSWSAGIALGPLAAGVLYDIDFRLPFVLMFLAGSVGVAFILTLPREQELHRPESRADHSSGEIEDTESEMFLWCAWAANAFGCALILATRSVFPDRIAVLVQAGELLSFLDGAKGAQWGVLAFALSASRAAFFFVLGHTTWWQHRFRVLVLFQVGAGAAMCLLAATQSLAVMIVCCLALGANNALTFFSSSYYSLANPTEKHRRASTHEGVTGLGNCAGPLVFGLLAGTFETTWPFRYAPAFVAGALMIQWALLMHSKRRFAGSVAP